MAADRLRVSLPMFTLVSGGMGGSETYASELATALARRDDVDIGIGTFPDHGGRLRKPPLLSTTSSGSVARLTRQLVAAGSPRARQLVDWGDVVHYPLSVPAPATRKPFIQTIHDVQHHDLLENFTAAERAYRYFRYDRPARRAAAVITISEFCRERIVSRLRLSPDVVFTAPLAVDHAKFNPNLGPRDRFVYYPARGWPHKNHARLIEALALVREEMPDLRLVLTGGGLESLKAAPPWVEVLGLVPFAQVSELYRRASCMVYPSLYEGFGLPLLEAMASGCPVACSSRGALQEVGGEAVEYFEPQDPRAIAVALLKVLRDPHPYATRGLEHAASFSWDRCADRHVQAYYTVVDKHRSSRRDD